MTQKKENIVFVRLDGFQDILMDFLKDIIFGV
jgi:hypothetical protein